MAITIPTSNLFFDTRRNLEGTEKYPVKLTIYFHGRKKRYKLPYALTKNEWQKINSPKLRDVDLKEIKTKLDFYVGEKFNDCLKKIEEPFTFEKFEDTYFEKDQPKQNNNVYTFYQSFIDDQNNKGRVGNAQIYETAMKTFISFRNKLTFNDITVDFIQSYEKQMLANGKSVAYTSMNIRTLRSIYNQAIVLKIATKENYPFSKNRNDKKFKIKKGKNTKKALTTEQLKQLSSYVAKTTAQQKALDLWLFSFYCNGLNFKDICQLRYKHIIDNKIIFTRAKTEFTTISNETIQFIVIPEIQEIINKYGNKKLSPNTYIFDIFKQGITPKQERKTVQSLTRNTNKHLKNICSDLKFEFSISTSWARHSFATYLKRSGSTFEVIGEALGHTNITTTRNYLDSFDDEALQKTATLLSQM